MSDTKPADAQPADEAALSPTQLRARYSRLKADVDTAEHDLYEQQGKLEAARAALDGFVARHRDALGLPELRSADDTGAAGVAVTPDRDRQNRSETNSMLKTALLVLLGVLGGLLLIALLWALGLFPRISAAAQPEPILGGETGAGTLGGGGGGLTESAVVGSEPVPAVDGRFQAMYDRYGINVLGRPISGVLNDNGLEVQWFERARLEYHPNLAGTPYDVQFSRLGAIYTDGRTFAEQQFFVSRPDLRYFEVTRHGVGGAFLDFWTRNGDVTVFGFPISEEFDEVLPDGITYRVQYFERARLEYHPQLAGSEHVVQAGLLGTALYSNDPRRPMTVQPIPTPVPLP